MKRIIFGLIIIVGMAAGSFAQQMAPPPVPSKLETAIKEKGDIISLEFKEIDVVEVIKILSRKARMNVVVTPGVKGRITLFLSEVKTKDALYTVLEAADLAYTEKAGIIQILPNKEYEASYGHEFYNYKKLVSFPIQYARASEIAASINKVLPKTKIVVDERTNLLLVQDSPAGLEEVKNAVKEMDRELVTQSYSYSFLTPKQAEELVKILLSKLGTFYVNPQIKQIVIRDYPENTQNLLALLKANDIAPQTITKAYELDYAKFDTLEAKLKILLTPDIGQIISDERTNKILITDLESNFEKIDKLVSEYDCKDKQVLIEAKIVQVLLNDRFQFGINWQSVIEKLNNTNLGLNLTSAYDLVSGKDLVSESGFSKNAYNIGSVVAKTVSPTDTKTSTTTTDIDEFGKSTTTTNIVRTLTETNETETTDEGDTVVAPFNQKISSLTNGGTRIVATGSINGHQFEGVLNALKAVGKTKVLSSPRIITLSQKEAKIEVATKEAYVTSTSLTTSSGPTSTSENITFIDVGISLSVTPIVNKDDYITMKVKPSISSVTSYAKTATGNSIPIVSSQSIDSVIQVKDGTSIVLGGLRESSSDKAVSKLPILGSIPIIGYLFKKIDNQIKNSELIMFLTPHLISGDKSFYEESEKVNIDEGSKEFLKEEKIMPGEIKKDSKIKNFFKKIFSTE